MAYVPIGVSEEDYRTEDPAEFRKRCATYGYTREKHGTGWDDKCIGYELKHKVGPHFVAPEAVPTKKEFPWKTVGVVAGVATVAYLLGRK